MNLAKSLYLSFNEQIMILMRIRKITKISIQSYDELPIHDNEIWTSETMLV
jgi:hypothetical protein